MINKVSNIDTICILIYIENYEISASNLLTRLQKEKQLLLEACRETNNFRYIINISGMEFELLPNGCKGYAFILKNEGFELKISLYQSKIENFAPLQVRISSEYLWSYGIEKSWQIISNWITSNIGKIALNKISRIDLCTHVSGYDFIENYENSYKGQFKKFDNTYKIVYNTMSKKYEIYSTKLTQSIELISGMILSYVCVLPFDELDERVIKYLYETSVKNIDNIIDMIDKQNKQIEYQNQLKLKNQSLKIAENKLRQLT